MRSIAIIVFICLTSIIGSAQEVQKFKVELGWHDKTIFIENNRSNPHSIQSFSDAELVGQYHDIASYILKFDALSFGRVSVKLENLETETIDNYLLSKINDKFEINSFIDQIRDSYLGGVQIIPIKKTSKGLERIVKADIVVSIDYDFNPSLRGPERTYTSVLSDGDIYAISCDKSGVYKLNHSDLSTLGVDISNIDPRNIKIYTNYGGILPERISDQNPDDLFEIPLIIEGESDGKFDSGDEVIFYLEGPDKWINSNGSFNYEKNIYDVKNYAYLKVNEGQGKRLNSVIGPDPEIIKASYSDYQIYHDDQVNLLALNASTEGSGKLWFGKKFTGIETLDLSPFFDLTNLVNNTIKIEGRFASRSETSSYTTLQIGSESFDRTYGTTNLESIQSDYASLRTFSASSDLDQGRTLTLKYNGGSESKGWLDYIKLRSNKNITGINSTVFLRATDDHEYDTYGYDISGINPAYKFLDVTDLANLKLYKGSNNTISYQTENTNRTIIAFDVNSLTSPELIGPFDIQNIHSIDDVDMVVLYPEVFQEAAERFIEHRSSHSNLEVVGVEVTKVYPEFSSGRQDPSAIRDFAKMLLDRNSRFKYLLFIGDGSYDQRGINSNIPDHRFIPVYETDRSLNPISSFPTDDYFALLSDNEGVGLDGGLDIAIGRLTVTTLEEANAVINKIIQYDTSPNRFGDWRIKGTFTADDEDTGTHLSQMDGIARYVSNEFPVINDQKIYLDAYRQETTPGGERYPEVEDAYTKAMDRGHLTFCYLGHGGPKGWAQERVLKVADIQEWDNINNQTLIISATCSFTGYDDPEIKSAGEHALLNPKGGTVALFTTVREVYANDNERLTSAVFENIYKKIDGVPPTFGDIITKAKNTNKQDTLGENSRKFSMIGDPSQSIAIPTHEITIDQINDIPINEFADTLGALQKVTVTGKVVDYQGNLLSNFNGSIFPTVFDKRTIIETLKNNESSSKTKIEVLKNIIFKGVASVENGLYSFSFVIPKDINYAIGKGKISLYATDGLTTDAAGAFTDLYIGGSSNSITDDEAPEIQLFINDNTFVSGDEVLPNSTLIAFLSDDLGINITGTGIGHDLTAELSGPIEGSFILNEFYEASLNDYTKGTVKFPLENLIPGDYTITVKAWDISNNSSESSIDFTVVENVDKILFDVKSYPNPFSDKTNISFVHDLGPVEAQIQMDVFSLSGQLIHQIDYNTILSGDREVVNLDQTGIDFSDKLANGLYIYKIKVIATALGTSRESGYYKMVKM